MRSHGIASCKTRDGLGNGKSHFAICGALNQAATIETQFANQRGGAIRYAFAMFDAPCQRLKHAREQRGYRTAKEAAEAMGVSVSTYTQHEGGARGIPKETAKRYAKFFGRSPEWLLFGSEAPPTGHVTVPLVGFVGTGSQVYAFAKKESRQSVDAPVIASGSTKAVELRMDGLGKIFDRWLAFYDDSDCGPVGNEHLDQLCLVGLPDGRQLVRVIQASRAPGYYHLTSPTGETPMLDQEVAWAARILGMAPR